MLIAAQPTRGVDIGATEYIHQRLLEQRDAGTAILLISEDLDEIQALSDRIAVMYEGQIIGVVDRGEATPEQIGLLMAGVALDAGDAATEAVTDAATEASPDGGPGGGPDGAPGDGRTGPAPKTA